MQGDVRCVFRRALLGVYVPSLYYWEAVIMVQRLSLAMIYTFASTVPIFQTTLCTLLCVVVLALHLSFAPMRDRNNHRFQAVLEFCLTVVALSRMLAACRIQLAVTWNDSAADALLNGLTVCFGYVVPIVALACLAFLSTLKKLPCWPKDSGGGTPQSKRLTLNT